MKIGIALSLWRAAKSKSQKQAAEDAGAERRARATMQWLDRFYDLDPRWDAVILPGETVCITRTEYERRLAAARVPMAGLFEEIRKAGE